MRAVRVGDLNPAEWVIFRCPGYSKVWTLVITSNRAAYVEHLRGCRARASAQCPGDGMLPAVAEPSMLTPARV